MLDNLRSQSSFEPEEEPIEEAPKPKPRRQRRSIDQITRMTAGQRFALAMMLLVMVCMLGFVLLLVTGRMVPPLGG